MTHIAKQLSFRLVELQDSLDVLSSQELERAVVVTKIETIKSQIDLLRDEIVITKQQFTLWVKSFKDLANAQGPFAWALRIHLDKLVHLEANEALRIITGYSECCLPCLTADDENCSCTTISSLRAKHAILQRQWESLKTLIRTGTSVADTDYARLAELHIKLRKSEQLLIQKNLTYRQLFTQFLSFWDKLIINVEQITKVHKSKIMEHLEHLLDIVTTEDVRFLKFVLGEDWHCLYLLHVLDRGKPKAKALADAVRDGLVVLEDGFAVLTEKELGARTYRMIRESLRHGGSFQIYRPNLYDDWEDWDDPINDND